MKRTLAKITMIASGIEESETLGSVTCSQVGSLENTQYLGNELAAIATDSRIRRLDGDATESRGGDRAEVAGRA